MDERTEYGRTGQSSVSATKRARSGRIAEWGFAPAIIGLAAVFPPYLALVRADFHLERYAAELAALASFLAPVGDDFYPAVGVLATVLLTFAAATGLGSRTRKFPKRIRRVMSVALHIGILTIALMSAACFTLAFVQPARGLHTVVAFAVAWVAILGAQVVTDIASPRRCAKEADAVWRKKKRYAGQYGILRTAPAQSSSVRWTGEVLVWCVPLLLWIDVGMAASISYARGPEDRWILFATCALLSFGIVIATAGWRVSADLSVPRRTRIWRRAMIVGIGVVLSVAFGLIVLAPEGYSALGITLSAFTLVHALVVMTGGFAGRVPGFSIVERGSTVRSLRRAHAYRDETRALAADAQRH